MITRKWTGSMTLTLILLNIALYIPLSSSEIFGCSTYYVIEHHQYYRLITSMFAHGSIYHLAVNMLSLYSIGSALESKIPPIKYLIGYFATGVIGSLVSFYLRDEFIISIGASGAIYGLYGILVGYFGSKENSRDIVLNFFLIILIGILIPYIDMWAHLGGLVSGLILGGTYRKFKFTN